MRIWFITAKALMKCPYVIWCVCDSLPAHLVDSSGHDRQWSAMTGSHGWRQIRNECSNINHAWWNHVITLLIVPWLCNHSVVQGNHLTTHQNIAYFVHRKLKQIKLKQTMIANLIYKNSCFGMDILSLEILCLIKHLIKILQVHGISNIFIFIFISLL